MCEKKYWLWLFPYIDHKWSSWVEYTKRWEEKIPNLFEDEEIHTIKHSEFRERCKCIKCGEIMDRRWEIYRAFYEI